MLVRRWDRRNGEERGVRERGGEGEKERGEGEERVGR